jgi:hypothetical protein
MKVGIVTFHCSINYGAILQAKALTIVIENMGCKCEIINYRLENDLNSHSKVFEKNIGLKSLVKNVIRGLHYRENKTRVQRFKCFYDNFLPVSNRIYKSFDELDKAQLAYDIYICGSDQIWRPIKNKYIDKTFYLGFSSALEGRRISYAPSFGTNDLPGELLEEIRELLLDFNSISVREMSGVNILKRKLNIEAKQVIDPTLLVPSMTWLSYCNKDLFSQKKYILVYAMEKNELFDKCILKLKKLTNYEVILISVDGIKRINNYDKVYYNIGPSEFLSLVYNARLILTNSFHGTAFSIIFEKPFISIPHSATNSRILELIESLEIENRQIKSIEEVNLSMMDLDYKNIKFKLGKLVNDSLEYLKSACKKGENDDKNRRSS